MGWSIGYDPNWGRDVGYGVPAICDHPDCNEEINRGLSYVCGSEPYGGEYGCGRYFCGRHRSYVEGDDSRMYSLCERCCNDDSDLFNAKQDVRDWVEWKLSDESWEQWRDENPEKVRQMQEIIDEEVD